jgi:predicted  nucleic acid-binding Zn-ribbon protein
MLVALILSFLFLGFSGDLPGKEFIDTLDDLVKESISEPERRNEIKSLVSDMEKELKGFSNQLKNSSKEIAELNRDHSSTREDFEEVLDALNAGRISSQEKILEIRFKMKKRMSRAEWQTVFGGSGEEGKMD